MGVLDIDIPEFTPMYHKIWWWIAQELPQIVFSGPGYPHLRQYQIVNARNAVAIDARRNIVWHHICHPRKLYEVIKDREEYPLSYGSDSRWELTLSYAYLNRDHSDLSQCHRCFYALDRTTRNLLRMEALGMLVK